MSAILERSAAAAATTTTATETKGERLSIRISGSQKGLLAEAAAARHQDTSEFVLQTALAEAERVLEESTRIRLTADEWEAFCRRLDEPARDIPALREQVKRAAVFV